MISEITSDHVDTVINHISSFQKEIYNINPVKQPEESVAQKFDNKLNQ